VKPTIYTMLLFFIISVPNICVAAKLHVVDEAGQPLSNVMVLQTPTHGATLDLSDMGYPPAGKVNLANVSYTKFTNDEGWVEFDSYLNQKVRYRFRLPDFLDITLQVSGAESKKVVMKPITDPLALAESRPANTWLAMLDLGGDQKLKKHYVMQCGFCHQQGSSFFRRPRTEDNWEEIIYRMVGYGSRLHDDAQDQLPKLLADEYARLFNNPALIPEGTPWKKHIQQSKITEWPIGDSFSQMHDLLYHSNGLIYVGDNLQDRMYEINPNSGEYVVYKLKREESDEHGGLLGKRLSSFPKHDTYAGIHSLAESKKDGHIFITTSYQQRLVEFDPKTKQFINHEMDEGYYPHTIRIDQKDRVWFTLALSNQVAMFERQSKKFRLFDLPTRSAKESMTISSMGSILSLMNMGVPLANWFSIDEQSTGVPLPYGIDITPNGDVWFARLHADSIGKIDAESLEITMYDTPFIGPRRLRSDAQGNLWIAAFPESMIVKFDPVKQKFTQFPLPVIPAGSETPYSLNVDRQRDIVWVNGNTSDALYRYDIKKNQWQHFPMSKRVTFTRDVEIAPNGDVFTTSASFPSWHIEDAQPTLIRLQLDTVQRVN
jgi:virginiamycin B lyase